MLYINKYNISELKKEFDEVCQVSQPKIITLGEAKNKYNFIPSRFFQTTETGYWSCHMLKHIDIEPVTAKTFGVLGGEQPHVHMFQAIKLMYLIHCFNTVGFYSLPQAILKDTGVWKVHPGTVRVKVSIHTETYDQKFIFWDKDNLIDSPVMSFDEWWGVFKDVPRRMWTEKLENILELHVEEDRDDYYEWNESVPSMYGYKRPYYHGSVPEELKDCFSESPDVPVHVEGDIKNNMKHFLDFNPVNKYFENDNIKIYCKV